MSFPCIPEDSQFSSILDDLSFYQVYTWSGSEYIHPENAEPGVGYWIFVAKDATLVVPNGAAVNSYTSTLDPGWNMIGSLLSYTVEADQVFPGFYQLYYWDGTNYISSDIIEPGVGYWAFVASTTEITVDENSATNHPPEAIHLQILHEPSSEPLSDDHECRMWGMIAYTLPSDTVMDHLVDEPYSLKNLGATNDDGWGLVYYPDSTSPPVEQRGDTPAASSPLFNVHAQNLADSGAIIGLGHVRAASQGATWIPDPHPFIRERGGRWWSFAHNGNVDKSTLYGLLGDYINEFDPPSYAPIGWGDPNIVDSDLYHIWVLKNIEENGWDVKAGIANAVSGLGGSGWNFILSDGEKIWGFRKDNTLHYIQSPDGYSAIVSQTPEGSGLGGWTEMYYNWNFVELSVDSPPVFISDIRVYSPPVYDELYVDYVYYDADGDPESGSEIRWYKDSVHQPGLDDSTSVPAGDTVDGEVWYYTVRPSDGTDFGPLMTSPTVVIGEIVVDLFQTQTLVSLDPGGTGSDYRWMDVADQAYSSSYISSYLYEDASVEVIYKKKDTALNGLLIARNLKPNFAYQVKLDCTPGTVDSERVGFVGRWWQQEWTGTEWDAGWNLNDKGDGSSPNPNDDTYLERRHIADPTSPTGYHYKYTGYLLFDYFITDENGDAYIPFTTGSSYHVLWKTTQSWPYTEGDDGPIKETTFNPSPSNTAYDTDYPEQTIELYGEYERLPMGETPLFPGEYTCSIVLTEESFHSQLGDPLEGNWAASLIGEISFTIARA